MIVRFDPSPGDYSQRPALPTPNYLWQPSSNWTAPSYDYTLSSLWKPIFLIWKWVYHCIVNDTSGIAFWFKTEINSWWFQFYTTYHSHWICVSSKIQCYLSHSNIAIFHGRSASVNWYAKDTSLQTFRKWSLISIVCGVHERVLSNWPAQVP